LKPVEKSVIDVTIQVGKKKHPKFQITKVLEENLSDSPKIKVNFGFGKNIFPQTNELKYFQFDFCARILELLSFDGSIIDFGLEVSDYGYDFDNNPNTSLETTGVNYLHNMKLINYKLYCGDNFFLNRLSEYENRLAEFVDIQGEISPDEFRFKPLDFVSCLTYQINTSLPNCVWGVGNVCLICDSHSTWDNYSCSECQINLETDLHVNNQYSNSCDLEMVANIPLVNVLEIHPTYDFSVQIYFIDSGNASLHEQLKNTLLFGKSEALNTKIKNPFQTNFKTMESSATTYNLDFRNIGETSLNFPLEISILHVIVAMNDQNQRFLISKNIPLTKNSYPDLVFTIRKPLISR
jgi:hypothetical protein